MFASIDVFGDAKNLTSSDDILNGDPACCQPSVELLRLLGQGLAPIGFDGRRTVGILFGYPLITTVSQFFSFGRNCHTTFLQNCVIVNTPFAAGNR